MAAIFFFSSQSLMREFTGKLQHAYVNKSSRRHIVLLKVSTILCISCLGSLRTFFFHGFETLSTSSHMCCWFQLREWFKLSIWNQKKVFNFFKNTLIPYPWLKSIGCAPKILEQRDLQGLWKWSLMLIEKLWFWWKKKKNYTQKF